MPTLVRRAEPADAQTIAKILENAFAAFKHQYTQAAWAATTPTAATCAKDMRNGPAFIAQHDEQSVGTVSCLLSNEAAYIRRMAVLPAAQGRGLGRRLLQAAEDEARTHGIRRAWLSTTPFLDAAIRLYETAGYEVTSSGPRHLHGTPLITMEKAL